MHYPATTPLDHPDVIERHVKTATATHHVGRVIACLCSAVARRDDLPMAASRLRFVAAQLAHKPGACAQRERVLDSGELTQ
jgi:hypothetical protein